MLEHVWTVIMAGGIGSRFWPVSRAARPKQLLDLFGDGPMLRVTSRRVAPLTPPERQLVVTSRRLGPAVRELLPELPADNVLEEPVGRNTAPAIGWAALEVRRRDPAGVLMVLPSDHYVADVDTYRQTCERALEHAATHDAIVTLGIPPTRPETGYGYIRRGDPIADAVSAVDGFREKPDRATALEYLAEGGYYWNAGMFFMPAQLGLDELARFEPELAAGLDDLGIGPDPATPEALERVYPTLAKISIDYAVMERSAAIAVVPGRFGWSDVGSWLSLHDFRGEGEASFTRGDVIEIGGSGNVLFADGGAVAAVGVNDLVVVHTADATLVCPREDAQRVREVVARLEDEDGTELL